MSRASPLERRAPRYVALGDSYIGTSVQPRERWPDQLVAGLPGEPPALTLVANLGVNGYTSGDLIRAELPVLEALLARLPANRIVTVAIPDYTVTPAGADYGDPRQQHDGSVANNEVMAGRSSQRGISHVDTFDLSLGAVIDRTLVAEDGLHPSGLQYAIWVERIAPVATGLLRH